MLKIKFSKCPLGKHKGEYWEKLKKIDLKLPVKLERTEITKFVPTNEEIKHDTFQDWDEHEWQDLMTKFYGTPQPVLFKLTFSQGSFIFTTFRGYTWQYHNHYFKNQGKEFEVVLT